MCGIFAYLNYLTPKTRKEVLEKLIGGLQRLEYRGYDSAGKWMWHDVQFLLQPADLGWPTGNGKKVSNSQACYLAQLCLATA